MAFLLTLGACLSVVLAAFTGISLVLDDTIGSHWNLSGLDPMMNLVCTYVALFFCTIFAWASRLEQPTDSGPKKTARNGNLNLTMLSTIVGLIGVLLLIGGEDMLRANNLFGLVALCLALVGTPLMLLLDRTSRPALVDAD